MPSPNDPFLTHLQSILLSRKQQDPKNSYVASLYHRGLNKILEKVGEEATEVILAAKDHHTDQPHTEHALVGEVADLWFHTLVLLSHQGIAVERVLDTLRQREGTSGHVEKAQRQKTDD